MTEIASYDPDGTLKHKYECTCDTDGNLTEMVIRKDDGSVRHRFWQRSGAESCLIRAGRGVGGFELDYIDAFRYNEAGHVSGITNFDGRGVMEYRLEFTYEFDVAGNWTKRTAKALDTTIGRVEWVPCMVTYRTITYF